jgi:hypothetical protein
MREPLYPPISVTASKQVEQHIATGWAIIAAQQQLRTSGKRAEGVFVTRYKS